MLETLRHLFQPDRKLLDEIEEEKRAAVAAHHEATDRLDEVSAQAAREITAATKRIRDFYSPSTIREIDRIMRYQRR